MTIAGGAVLCSGLLSLGCPPEHSWRVRAVPELVRFGTLVYGSCSMFVALSIAQFLTDRGAWAGVSGVTKWLIPAAVCLGLLARPGGLRDRTVSR